VLAVGGKVESFAFVAEFHHPFVSVGFVMPFQLDIGVSFRYEFLCDVGRFPDMVAVTVSVGDIVLGRENGEAVNDCPIVWASHDLFLLLET
jgi:hypothetical protein